MNHLWGGKNPPDHFKQIEFLYVKKNWVSVVISPYHSGFAFTGQNKSNNRKQNENR